MSRRHARCPSGSQATAGQPASIPERHQDVRAVAQCQPYTNELTVWTSTQVPHLVRLLLALVTGHPEQNIRVIAPDVGVGGFGSKLYLYAEEMIVAFIAKQLAGVPVKWQPPRTEDYWPSPMAGTTSITPRWPLPEDCTITAVKVTTYVIWGRLPLTVRSRRSHHPFRSSAVRSVQDTKRRVYRLIAC